MKPVIRVWDLPTRIFHWILSLAILGSIVTNYCNEIVLHSYCGYTALVLIIFRIVWGFIGPHHARFSVFLPSFATLRKYFSPSAPTVLGHSPLGALAVVALLLIILVQAVSGLFVDDDISFAGPLSKFISLDRVAWMNKIHAYNHFLVYGMIGLHLSAIAYYQFIKKNNLIGPMLHGDKTLEAGIDGPASPHRIASNDGVRTRVLAVVIVAVIVVVIVVVGVLVGVIAPNML